ncbi:MAG TPA: class I SAM-dependent methyltransferase [Bacteroidia bacterium]|nr:class I SAM-dependent methyltransferase [Bacteroidia bacterium]
MAHTIKDNFSNQSDTYAMFRPGYPDALFDFILNHTEGRSAALDCATGNGQVAGVLSEYFNQVFATDISEKQLQHAIQKSNIHYSVSRAEVNNFDNSQFDLITVGQAAHWFDLPLFYKEVSRILKPGGLLALFGYVLPTINEEVDSVIHEFYEGVLGKYWDPERKIVDDRYRSIPFPYQKITNNGFEKSYEWSKEQLIGFLSSWSAVQHYKKSTGEDAMEKLLKPMGEVWTDGDVKRITFPVFVIAGLKG